MVNFSGILYLYTEKIKDKGEDTMTFKFDEQGNGYMAVFDGCGGAGSEEHIDLNERKSAYVASRSCAYYLDYLNSRIDINFLTDTEYLRNQIYSYLIKINDKYPMNYSESTLVDVLPTTICGAFIDNSSDNLYIKFIWAGDSRGYIIDEDGLSQITEDDVDSEDAYYNLFDDSMMNNRIQGNLDKEKFKLNCTEVKLKSKGIVICATDGCYDYFNSPMVFEFFILTILLTSDNFSDAEKKFSEILDEKSGDDYSLTAVFYGFSDYIEIKEFIQSRFEFLNQDKDLFDERYWNEKYKKHYYRYNRIRGFEDEGN